MRKYAVANTLAIHASAVLLLLLLGTVARKPIHLPPAVILFEPAHEPRSPAVEREEGSGGGRKSPQPARKGRTRQPVKRRTYLPPMVAVNNPAGFHLL